MKRSISRGKILVTDGLPLVLRAPKTFKALALLTVVLLFGLSLSVSAQVGQRKLMKKKQPRFDNVQPVREQTPPSTQPSDVDAQEARQPPQPSPNDQYVPFGIGPRQRLALLRVFEQLNLSEDQREKLRQIRRETGNRLNVLSRLRRAQEDALEEAIHGNAFDPKLVEKRASELAETAGEMIKLQARILAEIRQIMTPEQSIRFRELMQREATRPFLPARP